MDAIRVILACIRKADSEFNLINENDRICLGISGGKDSMAMFYALHLYRKFSKTKFDIFPCIIDLGFDNFNPKNIEEYVNKLGYELKIADGKTVYQILKIQQTEQHTPNLPCSICSKMKKAIINKTAHDLNCNKVTFAHHRDDAIETLFLNEIYGGRIATFSPKMFLSHEKITFIRPIVLAKEEDLMRLCLEENIPISPSHCPNDKFTQREEIKKILANVYEKYPSSRENFANMLFNAEKEDIFYSHQELKIEGTPYYIQKTRSFTDFIDEINYTKETNFDEISKNSIHYNLLEEKSIRASLQLHRANMQRIFSIVSYTYDNDEIFRIFVKEIINLLYFEYNPCTLFIKQKDNNYKILEELGFTKSNDSYELKIINEI